MPRRDPVKKAAYDAEYALRARSRKLQHARHRQYVATRLAWLNEVKSKPCMDCGKMYPPYVMDFDHVRGKKLFNIGPQKMTAKAKLVKEIAKCDLVCANCHRRRTWERRNYR